MNEQMVYSVGTFLNREQVIPRKSTEYLSRSRIEFFKALKSLVDER